MNYSTSGIGRSAFGSLVMKMVQIGTGLFTVFLLSSLLGPEEFGRYSFAFAWIQVLHIVVMLGFHQLMIREVAKAWGKKDLDRMRTILAVGFSIPLVLSGILALVGIFAQAGFIDLTFWKKLFGSPVLVLLGLLPSAMVVLYGSVMQGMGRVVMSQVPAVLIRPAFFLFLILLVYIAPGIILDAELALSAQVAGACVAALFGWIWLSPVLKYIKNREKHPVDMKWKGSAGAFFILTLVTVLLNRVDTLMLGWLGNSSEVGTYALIARAAEQVLLPLIAARMALAPRVAYAAGSGGLSSIRPVLARYTRLAFVLAISMVAGYVFFGSWLLGILDPAYRSGFPALIVLAGTKALGVGFGMVVMLLNMSGMERISLFAMIGAVGLNIFLNSWLIPLWGVMGCATATSVSLLSMQTTLSVITSRKFGIGPLGFRTASSKNIGREKK